MKLPKTFKIEPQVRKSCIDGGNVHKMLTPVHSVNGGVSHYKCIDCGVVSPVKSFRLKPRKEKIKL